MALVHVCPLCGEKVEISRDEFVVYHEKHEGKPQLYAHAKCMSATIKGR
jgi:hypothetical protein